jgi:hypothetical protein
MQPMELGRGQSVNGAAGPIREGVTHRNRRLLMPSEGVTRRRMPCSRRASSTPIVSPLYLQSLEPYRSEFALGRTEMVQPRPRCTCERRLVAQALRAQAVLGCPLFSLASCDLPHPHQAFSQHGLSPRGSGGPGRQDERKPLPLVVERDFRNSGLSAPSPEHPLGNRGGKHPTLPLCGSAIHDPRSTSYFNTLACVASRLGNQTVAPQAPESPIAGGSEPSAQEILQSRPESRVIQDFVPRAQGAPLGRRSVAILQVAADDPRQVGIARASLVRSDLPAPNRYIRGDLAAINAKGKT